MSNNKIGKFPKWITVLAIIFGSIALYFAFKLGFTGRFNFKGSHYSATDTPISFWVQVLGLFVLGLSMIVLPFIPERWFNKDL
ncbi:hypothetical protein J1N51_01935 [Psychrosphaera ytuae]|uniref:Uncharacterized protein n=1 Tax=Psychrosphaera ytuae TaxID=2820710 RepID=A0A975DCC4_9GAMM|nr:hypothetical protein [Psychrosphaera ytuae]QTH64268.1 hypothetical protein J1N51_01935 [Psychrosphaera ytuae]